MLIFIPMSNKKNFFEVIFLGFFSILYGIVVSFRNFCYDNKIFKSKEYDLPIISVGNITVGGTGKTPHTEFLLRMLKDQFSVAVLSRGYKRKTKGFKLVEVSDTHYAVGDEPLQIKQKFPDVVVAVCEKRTKGVEKIKELYPDMSLIILDDAFQHRQITPGISILLNNYNAPISEDYLLPLGRLREKKSSSHRANVVIYSKCPTELKPIEIRILTKEMDLSPYQHLLFSTIKYHNLKSVFFDDEIELNDLKKYNLLALTGIARPGNLTDLLEMKSNSLIHLKYPDHYNFKKKDVNTILKTFAKIENEKIIVVTEKDAVRIKSSNLFPEDFKKYIYSIPIEVELLCTEDEKKQFENQIINYVRNNKTYSNLYKGAYSG
jgi:tetraacyldisaccharide 4'-kinase